MFCLKNTEERLTVGGEPFLFEIKIKEKEYVANSGTIKRTSV